jgi:hypothetical protein
MSDMEGGKRSAWLKHVMKVKKANPSFSLGDAMKAAKKTYKKGGSLGMPVIGNGGEAMVKQEGGTIYGFVGGPYVPVAGSEALTDGARRLIEYPRMAYVPGKDGPNSELLGGGQEPGIYTPGVSGAPKSDLLGGRRRRKSRKGRKSSRKSRRHTRRR